MNTIRKRRNMTMKEVSEAIKTSDSYWYQYEHGARRPSLTLISRMRRHIDLTDDEILDLVAAVMDDEDALEAQNGAKTEEISGAGPVQAAEVGHRAGGEGVYQARRSLRDRAKARLARNHGPHPTADSAG